MDKNNYKVDVYVGVDLVTGKRRGEALALTREVYFMSILENC